MIGITPLTPVNPVGSPEMFTVTVTAFPGTTGTPSFGALTATVSGGLTPTVSAATINGDIATWTVTIDSNTSGTFTVQASDTVTMGGLAITRTTGDGFTSGNGNDSSSAVKNYVNALIGITPLTPINPLNYAGDVHHHDNGVPVGHRRAVVHPADGDLPRSRRPTVGLVTPLSGPSLQPDGSWIETWTETIDSNVAGFFNVQASDTVTMGGVVITRTTGDGFTSGNGSDSASAVKHYVDANISSRPDAGQRGRQRGDVHGHGDGLPGRDRAPSFGALGVTVSGGLTPTVSGPTVSGDVATWTVTIDSAAAGTFTVTASDTATMGGVAVTSPPATASAAATAATAPRRSRTMSMRTSASRL